MKHSCQIFFHKPIVSFIVIALFFLSGCMSKGLIKENWQSTMIVDREEIFTNLKFQENSFKAYAKGSHWKHQIAQGTYATANNIITFTVTHEFNNSTHKMEELKTAKTYRNSYILKSGKLILK